METLKKIVIVLLNADERIAQLSYYQFSRKLKNKDMHDLVPQLPAALDELVNEGLLEVEEDPSTGCPFYRLSQLGKSKVH